MRRHSYVSGILFKLTELCVHFFLSLRDCKMMLSGDTGDFSGGGEESLSFIVIWNVIWLKIYDAFTEKETNGIFSNRGLLFLLLFLIIIKLFLRR